MKTVNIHEAKTHLSRLVDEVAKGEPFIIAKAGRPMARVVPYTEVTPQRIGFLKGQCKVPDDFDTMHAEEIADMFEGNSDGSSQIEKQK